MNGLRQIMTPNGPILVSDEEAASLGFGDPTPPPQEFSTPTLPPPAETPVPDVAFATPPAPAPEAAGLAQVDAPPVPAPTPTPAPARTTGAAPAAPAPVDTAPTPGPAPAPQQPLDLSKVSHGDIVQAQQANLGEQAAAQQQVGEKEAQALEAQAAEMQRRNEALDAKAAADAEAQAREQAEIERKQKVWEAKNEEWMSAKVTRRGISTGELIGMAIAGLGSAMKGQGGQNPAIGIVMQKIQQDVDDQIRERDELGKRAGAAKGAVDYARELASDAQAQRLAATGMIAQRHAREIETIAANTQSVIKREQLKAQAAELKGAGLQLVAQGKERQDQVDARNAQLAQAERESKRQAGLGYARLREDKRQFGENLALRREEMNRDALIKEAELKAKLAAAQRTGNEEERKQAEHDLKMAQDKRERTVQFVRPMVKRDEQGKAVGQDWAGLKNSDGQDYTVADASDRKEVETKLAAASQFVDTLDRIQELRNKYGSEAFKTAEGRQMLANYSDAVTTWKDIKGLGALSGDDLRLAQQAMGTADPTEWRKIDAGLQEARRRTLENTDKFLRAKNYTGEKFDIPNLTSQGLGAAADLGEAGSAVKSLEKDSRSMIRMTGEEGGLVRGIAPANSVRLTAQEAPRVASLIEAAQTGDESARAGLAKLTKDRVLGKAVMVEIAQSGLDLSDKMSPDDWEMVRVVRGETGPFARKKK